MREGRRIRALEVEAGNRGEAVTAGDGDGDGVAKGEGGDVLPSYGEATVGSEAGDVVRPVVTGEGGDVVRPVERAHLRNEAAGVGTAPLTVRNI